MFKRYRANYSLWPEYARSRRGNSLKFAAGSFVFGVVCAAAAYGAVFNVGAPTTSPQQEAARPVQHVPVYASAVEQAGPPAPAQVEGDNRSNRPRIAAKVTLPMIGSQTEALPLVATGGGDSEKLAGEAPDADVRASAGRPSMLARREAVPPREQPVSETRSDEAKPIATADRSAKARKTIVETTAKQPAPPKRDAGEAREAGKPVPVRQAQDETSDAAKPIATAERLGKPLETVVEKTAEQSARPAREARKVSEPVRERRAREVTSDAAKPIATAERLGKPRETVVEKTPEEPAHPAREARETSAPVRERQVREARSEEKPAAERAARPSKNAVEKKREGSTGHVARSNSKREQSTRPAKRQRPDTSSSTMMEAALRALRLVTEGQGLLGM